MADIIDEEFNDLEEPPAAPIDDTPRGRGRGRGGRGGRGAARGGQSSRGGGRGAGRGKDAKEDRAAKTTLNDDVIIRAIECAVRRQKLGAQIGFSYSADKNKELKLNVSYHEIHNELQIALGEEAVAKTNVTHLRSRLKELSNGVPAFRVYIR